MIHSMVEYVDHSIIAQMSVPDMRHCVQYALTHPRRLPAEGALAEADLFSLGKMTFARPDTEVFSLLALARDCIAAGGALPCVLNAANEVVVAAFLREEIRFFEIPELVAQVVDDLRYVASHHAYDQLLEADALARARAASLCNART
jgi:1-deoxy-D-xylulose-5-phosphate reductoisomerase